MSRPVSQVLQLARSLDYRDRVTAGHELALLVDEGDAQVQTALLQLLLDPDDTAVTVKSADALLARGGPSAWSLFLHAWARADPEQLDHLYAAFSELWWRLAVEDDLSAKDALRTQLEPFALDGDADARAAAGELLERVNR